MALPGGGLRIIMDILVGGQTSYRNEWKGKGLNPGSLAPEAMVLTAMLHCFPPCMLQPREWMRLQSKDSL